MQADLFSRPEITEASFAAVYCSGAGAYWDALGVMNAGKGVGVVAGVLSQNRRNFRHPSSSPATSASKSIILPSLWKV